MNNEGTFVSVQEAMNSLEEIRKMIDRIQESPTFRNRETKEEFIKHFEIVMKYLTSVS